MKIGKRAMKPFDEKYFDDVISTAILNLSKFDSLPIDIGAEIAVEEAMADLGLFSDDETIAVLTDAVLHEFVSKGASVANRRRNASSQYAKDGETVSFWVATAFDMRSTAYAYGACITYPDGYKWPENKNRFKDYVGQKYFYEYSKGTSKSFNSYESLINWLEGKCGYKSDFATEQQLVDSARDERYYSFCY